MRTVGYTREMPGKTRTGQGDDRMAAYLPQPVTLGLWTSCFSELRKNPFLSIVSCLVYETSQYTHSWVMAL